MNALINALTRTGLLKGDLDYHLQPAAGVVSGSVVMMVRSIGQAVVTENDTLSKLTD